MKRYVAIMLALAAIMALPATAQPAEKIKIGVMSLKSTGAEGVVLADRLSAELVKGGMFDVVERSARDAAVAGLGPAGAATDEVATLARIGQKLDAAKVVGGSIGLLGDTWVLNLVVVDVAAGTAEQAVTKNIKGKVDGVLLFTDAFAKQLVARQQKQIKAREQEKLALARRAEALAAKKEQLEKERIKLKEALSKIHQDLEKAKLSLDQQYRDTEEKIAVQDKKIEEMKASGKKPATDPAKARAALERKGQDILGKKEARDKDKDEATKAAAKRDEDLVKLIAEVAQAQQDVAEKRAAFEPKPQAPAPAPVDTIKKAEPVKPDPKPAKRRTKKGVAVKHQ